MLYCVFSGKEIIGRYLVVKKLLGVLKAEIKQ